jgi:response regulator RpfG family c-di-GMP phosphodiesterase
VFVRKNVIKKNSDINILIIDDVEEHLETLKMNIENLGYNCFATNNIDEAISMVKGSNPQIDIVITDFLMVGLMGDYVVNEVRKFNSYVYIILLTGYTDNMPGMYAMRNFQIDSYSIKQTNCLDITLKVEIAVKSILKLRTLRPTGLKFEEKLKHLRLVNNKTQDEVASILGIKRSTVAAYETGTIRPGFDILEKIVQLYNVDYNYILG